MRKQNLDSPDTVVLHKRTIKENKILHNLYRDFYKQLYPKKIPPGPIVELGSGGGFMKEMYRKIITSDIVAGPGINKVFSASNLPFDSQSVSAFVMLNVLHHIKDPQKALEEMSRCLKRGGKIIMIEPYNSPWSRLIYTYLHHEEFDPNVRSWKVRGKGRLSDANAALPWIIFVRDRHHFQKLFPELKIKHLYPHTPFGYLLSGGLSKPQIAPFMFYKFTRSVGEFLSPLNHLFGMFVTIELQKDNDKNKK